MSSNHIEYTNSEAIFQSQLQRRNDKKKNFTFLARFLSLKPPNFIILKDYSSKKEDIHFHVRCLNQEIFKKFENYFRPWFLFRFEEILLTASNSSFKGQPRILNFNCSNPKSIVIFELIKTIGSKFKFHVSDNPTITESDWKEVELMQENWCNEINNIAFKDLKRIFTLSKCSSLNISFMAQLIEIKQFNSRLLLIKAWDGTTPDFVVSIPINSASIAQSDPLETEECIIKTLSDTSLDEETKYKKVYITAHGENVGKFYGKKPKDLVLIINAKMSYSQHNDGKIYRIELSKSGKDERIWVKRFDANTNLGILLMKRINSSLASLPSDLMETDSIAESLVTGDSFDRDIPRNQIFHKYTFDDFELLKNYDIFCSIKDVFPLDYKVFDLINLKCTDCGLEESVQDLFEVDLEGLRRASDLYLIENGPDKKEIICISCNKPTAYFRYKIIFLLEDRIGNYLLGLLDGIYAERYFQIKPIEILASKEKEFVFKNKFEELKKIFNHKDGFLNRSMIIFRDGEIYEIKAINFKRNI